MSRPPENRDAAWFAGWWANYAKAAAVTALAVLLRWCLDRLFGQLPLFITFYPAVVVSAMFWGTGPGALATILSIVAVDLCFIEPIGSLAIANRADAVAVGLFGTLGLALSLLGGRVRAATIAQTQRAEAAAAKLGQASEHQGHAEDDRRDSGGHELRVDHAKHERGDGERRQAERC